MARAQEVQTTTSFCLSFLVGTLTMYPWECTPIQYIPSTRTWRKAALLHISKANTINGKICREPTLKWVRVKNTFAFTYWLIQLVFSYSKCAHIWLVSSSHLWNTKYPIFSQQFKTAVVCENRRHRYILTSNQHHIITYDAHVSYSMQDTASWGAWIIRLARSSNILQNTNFKTQNS